MSLLNACKLGQRKHHLLVSVVKELVGKMQ